jgi:hypothetical protein
MGRKSHSIQNWSDPYISRQITNQVAVEEYMKYCRQKSHNWTQAARGRLEYFGIYLKESSIKQLISMIKNGSRLADMPSSFGGEIRSRTGKDRMYGQFDMTIEYRLKEKNYIGLPYNQLIHMIQKYDHVIACEKDRKSFEFMFNMKRLFAPKSNSTVHFGNIFHYLQNTDRKFSIYDFDLMQHLTTSSIKRIADLVLRTTEDVAAICIASCVGRSGSHSDYKIIMPSHFIKYVGEKNYDVIFNHSGEYYDRITPMRYEIMVIQRKGMFSFDTVGGKL